MSNLYSNRLPGGAAGYSRRQNIGAGSLINPDYDTLNQSAGRQSQQRALSGLQQVGSQRYDSAGLSRGGSGVLPPIDRNRPDQQFPGLQPDPQRSPSDSLLPVQIRAPPRSSQALPQSDFLEEQDAAEGSLLDEQRFRPKAN